MWSQPPQWLQASHYENVPHNEVDWASLAKQWISMQQQPSHPMVPSSIPPLPPTYSTTDPGLLEPPGDDLMDPWRKHSQGGTADEFFSRSGQPLPPPPPPPPANPNVWAPTSPEFLANSRQVVDYGHGGPAAVSARPTGAVVLDYGHGDGSSSNLPERRVVDYGHGFTQSGTTSLSTIPPGSIPPVVSTASTDSTIAIDAMKRKNLPAWIRDGLEKMEREKQKKKEEEERRKKLEQSNKPLWAQEVDEDEADETGTEPLSRTSRVSEEESDEELPDVNSALNDEPQKSNSYPSDTEPHVRKSSPTLILLSPEERELQFALNVKRLMTEILMSVLISEVQSIAQEQICHARSRVFAKPKKVTTALASIVGIGGYSDSDASDNEDIGGRSGSRGRYEYDNQDSDLEERIKIRRKEFQKWEESVMRVLDEKEKEQQRRLNGDDREDSQSPAHGTHTLHRSPPSLTTSSQRRNDRSPSSSPKSVRTDPTERTHERLLNSSDKSPPRFRTQMSEYKKEKRRRPSSRSSDSDSSISSDKRKRSSKKDRRRSRSRERSRRNRDSSSSSRSPNYDYRRTRSGSKDRRNRSRSRDRCRDKSGSYDERKGSRDLSRDRKLSRDTSRDRKPSRDLSRTRKTSRELSRDRKSSLDFHRDRRARRDLSRDRKISRDRSRDRKSFRDVSRDRRRRAERRDYSRERRRR